MCRSDWARLVVDAGIEAEVGNDMLAFRWTAGDADNPADVDACDLPCRAAGGASCRRHDQVSPALMLAMSTSPTMAVAPDCPTMPRLRESGLKSSGGLRGLRPSSTGVFVPAELALHAVAAPEIAVAALDHQARAASDHRTTRLQRLGGLTVPTAHLPAHVGVDRQNMSPGENLASAGLGTSTSRKQPASSMPSGRRL